MTYLYVSLQSIISKNQSKCEKNFTCHTTNALVNSVDTAVQKSLFFQNRTLIKSESTMLYKGRNVRFVSKITWPATELLNVPVHKYENNSAKVENSIFACFIK